MIDDEKTARTDREQLKLLSILHYVWGGMQMLGGVSGVTIVLMGGMFASGAMPAQNPNERAMLQMMGTVFSVMGMAIIFWCFVIGVAILYAGYCLGRDQAHLYCMVVAVVECLSFPLGTGLGVFTLIVLMRDSVKERFARAAPSP